MCYEGQTVRNISKILSRFFSMYVRIRACVWMILYVCSLKLGSQLNCIYIKWNNTNKPIPWIEVFNLWLCCYLLSTQSSHEVKCIFCKSLLHLFPVFKKCTGKWSVEFLDIYKCVLKNTSVLLENTLINKQIEVDYL